MKGVGIVRETVIASALLAAIALFVAVVLGHVMLGVALAAGLLIGSVNGELIRRVLLNRASFVISSMVRLALVSGLAVILSVAAGMSPIALLLGVAAAQFVMVATAVREGLKTR